MIIRSHPHCYSLERVGKLHQLGGIAAAKPSYRLILNNNNNNNNNKSYLVARLNCSATTTAAIKSSSSSRRRLRRSITTTSLLAACAVILFASLPPAGAAERGKIEEEEEETLGNVPQTLAGECEGEEGKKDCNKATRIQRPKSRKAETCTVKCVNTCIRGGDGEGPLNIRRPLVVFKQGFRSRHYCLVECSEICNLIGDGDDGP